MKKYRLTRIKVKTREIVRLSKDTADEDQIAVCPLCRTPFALALPSAEKPPPALTPADDSGAPDHKLKGDL